MFVLLAGEFCGSGRLAPLARHAHSLVALRLRSPASLWAGKHPRAPMQNGGPLGGTCEPPPSRILPGTSISQSTLPESAAEGPPSQRHPDSVISRAPRAPHTWTQCPGSAFHVRQGPNYAATGKKSPSGPPLYEVVACDAFTSETKLLHLARVMALPEEPSCSDVPPLLIVNFMVPNYQPSGMMAAAKRTDGPGWNLVLYCRLTPEARKAIEEGRSAGPALALWRRFVHPTEGLHLRQNRVKMIFGLTDTEAAPRGQKRALSSRQARAAAHGSGGLPAHPGLLGGPARAHAARCRSGAAARPCRRCCRRLWCRPVRTAYGQA